MLLVEAKDISKSFPGVRALDNVSFEANAGEIVGVVGVNGAGKSTLMNILGGIYQPDDGDILVDGERIVRASAVFTRAGPLADPPQS